MWRKSLLRPLKAREWRSCPLAWCGWPCRSPLFFERGPAGSAGQGRHAQVGIVAHGRHGFQCHVSGALGGPFIHLFQRQGADETQDGGVVVALGESEFPPVEGVPDQPRQHRCGARPGQRAERPGLTAPRQGPARARALDGAGQRCWQRAATPANTECRSKSRVEALTLVRQAFRGGASGLIERSVMGGRFDPPRQFHGLSRNASPLCRPRQCAA